MTRRDYGTGSVYQRCETRYGCPPRSNGTRPKHTCRARWYGTIEAGWTREGIRDRVTVSGKTKGEATKKLNAKRREVDAGGAGIDDRVTVKTWAATYLELRKNDLRPKAWNAAASPIRKWVVPTIGHRRLSLLTPADIRAVSKAQYDAGRKTATADATQRALMKMLRDAIAEGHTIPQRVLMVPKPGPGHSDRTDLTLEESLACLAVAAELPHGTRWALALLYGARQGEVLGLVEDCIDFDTGEIRLEWQLQALPYADRKNKRAGFRVPRDYEARHLVDAWHLVRPKSRSGHRVLPIIPGMETALRAWLDTRPANPWGLVYPTLTGRPTNDKADREEWWALQGAAEVGHPAGRYYHVHECRNVAATQLDETGASDNVITSLLGHTSILTSRRYMTAHAAPKRAAMMAVGERLGLGLPSSTEVTQSS